MPLANGSKRLPARARGGSDVAMCRRRRLLGVASHRRHGETHLSGAAVAYTRRV